MHTKSVETLIIGEDNALNQLAGRLELEFPGEKKFWKLISGGPQLFRTREYHFKDLSFWKSDFEILWNFLTILLDLKS